MKLETDEKELLESLERGEWKSAGGGKSERATLATPKPHSARTGG